MNDESETSCKSIGVCVWDVFCMCVGHPPRLKNVFHDVTPNLVWLQQMPAPDESINNLQTLPAACSTGKINQFMSHCGIQ